MKRVVTESAMRAAELTGSYPVLVATIPVVRPFPWSHLLQYLSRRFTPGIERVTADTYHRKLAGANLAVTFDEHAGSLQVHADDPVDVVDLTSRVRALFDVGHDARQVTRHLGEFGLLRARIDRVAGMRPAGAWSPFELCVRTIVGQQVTVAAAGTLMQRLVDRCGEITAAGVLSADLDRMGMPGRRVDSIRGLARAVSEQRIHLDDAWPALDAALATMAGFGPWTRAYLAIRLGRDPDAFAPSDLGLMRAAGVDSPSALLRMAEAWRPYRAHAATYLWSVDLAG